MIFSFEQRKCNSILNLRIGNSWPAIRLALIKTILTQIYVLRFPSNTINFVKHVFWGLALDRSNLWRHFASRTFSENGMIFVIFPCFFCFLVKTSSDDGVGHPWQGPCFSSAKKTHVPFQKNTYIAVLGCFFLKN